MPAASPSSHLVSVQRLGVDRILTLRHVVLRAGHPPETASFSGDLAATTLHLAALADNLVIGCASFMLNSFDDEPAYQLRGMAIAADWQGHGIGRRILAASDLLLRDDPVTLRWCNARVSAIPFYERLGWAVVSPEFDIPTTGPHRRMTRRV